jgi:GT2 family glycosyltransferase
MLHELKTAQANSSAIASPAKVGVVTVTYNSAKVIDGFLTSLLAQTFQNFILYVVDNISSDETLARLATYRDARIRVIANPDNRGIAEGNNQGIRAALEDGCSLILLLNNDTEFEPKLLERLVAGIDRTASDMVAPKILFHHDQNKIWSAGGGLDARRAYSGFHHGYGETDRGQFDQARPVQHAPACCLLIRENVFRRIGVMDDRYFAYVEDTDFCYRAMRAGLTITYLPEARMLHKAHSLTGGLFSPFMMRYTTRNRTYFMLKHFGRGRGLLYVIAYQLYLVIQVLARRVKWSMFVLRERAFLEGLRLWRESVAR